MIARGPERFFSPIDANASAHDRDLYEREQQENDDLLWFTGLAESGMAIFLNTGTDRKGEKSVIPTMVLQSYEVAVFNYLEKKFYLERFHPENPRRPKNNRWTLTAQRALDLASDVRPFLVSRTTILEAFSLYENTPNVEEQIELVNDTRDHDRFAGITPEQYTKLLRNPAFVAGVIDGRGYVHLANKRSLRLDVSSKNEALLHALCNKYGGSVDPKNGSYNWVLHNDDDVRKVLMEVHMYLHIPLPEGWKEIKIPPTKQQRNQEVEELERLIREEMEAYERAKEQGQLFRFRTREEWAAQLHIKHFQIMNRFRSLPTELRNERLRAIKKENSRTVSPAIIGLIVQAVIQEVKAYEVAKEMGKTTVVRNDSELAADFDIPVFQVRRLVTPLLSQKLSEQEQRTRRRAIYEKSQEKQKRRE